MLEGIADGSGRRDRHRSRAASCRREDGRVRPRAVRHRRPRDRRCRWCSTGWCTPDGSASRDDRAALSTNPARVLNLPGGTLAEGAPADITVLARSAVTVDVGARLRRSRRTRRSTAGSCAAAVVATIVGGASSTGEIEARLSAASTMTTRTMSHEVARETMRRASRRLKKLQELEVLMPTGTSTTATAITAAST